MSTTHTRWMLRFWWGIWIAAILAAFALAALYFWLPVDGATGDLESFSPQGFRVKWLLEKRTNGLQVGDLIVRAGGYTPEEWLRGVPRGPEWQGGVVTYEVLRNGQLLNLPIKLHPIFWGAVHIRWLPQLLIGAFFWLIGTLVFIKRADELAARLLMLFCVTVGLQYWGDAFNFQFALLPWRWPLWAHTLFEHLSYSLSIATICYFALIFPVRHPLIDRHPRLVPLMLYLVHPVIIGGAMLLARTHSQALVWSSHASWVLALTQIGIAIAAGFRSTYVANDPITRAQVRWIVWCAVVGAVVLVPGYVLPLILTGYSWLPHSLIMVFIIALPIVLAITILRYHLFEIELVINRSLVYGTLTLLLGGFYILLVRVLTLFVERVIRTENRSLIIFVSTLSIALAFAPMRNWVQRWIDRAFYRTQVDFAELVFEVSERLVTSIVLDRLVTLLTDELPARLNIEWAVLGVLDGEARFFVPQGRKRLPTLPVDHPVISFVQTYDQPLLRLFLSPTVPQAVQTWLTEHQIELVIPLISGHQMVGFYALGGKRSEMGYNRQDVRLLRALGQQIAVSVQNARLYQQVEHYGQTLEIQVRERTQELQKAYHYLAQQHTTLNVILENVADGLVVVDLDGRITRINRVFAHMVGDQSYQEGESALNGQELREVLADPSLERIVEQAIQTPSGIFSTNVVKDDKTYRALACALHGRSYPVSGVVIVFRDISYELRLAQMKDDFVSDVTHELRTPLTSIIGFANLIEYQMEEKIAPVVSLCEPNKLSDLERIERDLRIIVDQGQRLSRLIDSLLDFSKLEAGRVDWKDETVYLEELIEQSVASVRSLLINKPVTIRIDLAADLPPLSVDPDRITQVLTNLLSNAAKYTDQGEISVCAWTLSVGDDIPPVGARPPNLGLRLPAPEPMVAISVSDTGVGIAEQDLPYLFERFRQVGDEAQGRRRKGTGLGLAISKNIVEHYGGQLWVESQVGRGSRFVFTLRLNRSSSED